MDITKMSPMDLMKNKHESLADISVCKTALKAGLRTYGRGQSIQNRLEANQDAVLAINAELARRETEDVAQVED